MYRWKFTGSFHKKNKKNKHSSLELNILLSSANEMIKLTEWYCFRLFLCMCRGNNSIIRVINAFFVLLITHSSCELNIIYYSVGGFNSYVQKTIEHFKSCRDKKFH